LRSQALKPTAEKDSCPKSIDIAFIERQGLVAWIERGPGNNFPVTQLEQAKASPGGLVTVLADLVVGQPEEAEDDG
jgi:hypothetical protein